MKGFVFYLFDYLTGSEEVDIFTLIIRLFSLLVVIFLCFPIHECAHAYVAKILGDDTAEREGRITLNPIAHIDPMGVLFMAICNIGWAKPTPVELRRCRKVTMRTANVLVSLAGPVSNLLLAFIVTIIYKILIVTGLLGSGVTAFYIGFGIEEIIITNIYLGIFNLLPVPPFDGYHILATFLPFKTVAFIEQNERIIRYVAFMLIISRVITKPIETITYWIYDFYNLITQFICWI